MNKCVICCDIRKNASLNHVGDEATKTMENYAKQLGDGKLLDRIKQEKIKKYIYVHLSCRLKLKNSCLKRSLSADDADKERKSKVTCRLTRSDFVENFNFKDQCFYCGSKFSKSDSKNPAARKTYRIVSSKDSELLKNTLELCRSNPNNKISKLIELRLINVSDLVCVDARYHPACRLSFERDCKINPGRPQSTVIIDAFEEMCKKLDNMEAMTLHDFAQGMEQISGDTYKLDRTIKPKLMEKYGDNITFVQRGGGKGRIIVLDKVAHRLANKWYQERNINANDEENWFIKTAVSILKQSINDQKIDKSSYPSVEDIISEEYNMVPDILMSFVKQLIKDKLKQRTLSQAIFAACRTTAIMPLQFALAISADNMFGSKWLANILDKFGFAVSYDEVIRFKQSVIEHESMDQVLEALGSGFFQFVGDNTDHDLNTIDGKGTHHGLGSIVVTNGMFGNVNLNRTMTRIVRSKKQNWSSLPNNEGIPILSYERNPSVLKITKLEPLIQGFHQDYHSKDLVWIYNRLCKNSCPNWAGFMSSFTNTEVKSASVVTLLPIIDLHATDPTALYSLLTFISSQTVRLDLPATTVTFDQPLYIKAYEIVADQNMNIFVRLGGFHQMMSFLGSLGYVMEGSGLREALETVYAPISVGHMFSGKAYSRALRGHLLTYSALMSLIIEPYMNMLSEDDLKSISEVTNPLNLDDDEDGSRIIDGLIAWVNAEKLRLSSKSRTGALWIAYIDYVSVILDFIRAERTSNWLLHLDSTRRMLNLFASTGHMNYAKTSRLYLQSAAALAGNFSYLHGKFMSGEHTVRRKESSWSGLWTDLSIEQILMKSLKGRGGVIGRGITENVTNVWTKTMHRCAEITNSVETICISSKKGSHQELMPARLNRDNQDYVKVLEYFWSHNPFNVVDKLISLESGLVDDNHAVNCDNAEAVGAKVQEEMTGKMFAEVSLKKKNKVTNLQTLYSTVKINDDKVDINPLTLFLRLVTVVDRKPQQEIANFFSYELSSFPMSLFKNGFMRPPSKKSSLKEALVKDIVELKPDYIKHHNKVLDGGALLWACDWKKGELYGNIFMKYVKKCKVLGATIVVFDGYESSTKSETQVIRSKCASTAVEIDLSKKSVTDRSSFMSNYSNKSNFIGILSTKLTSSGIRAIQASSDADTTIVKTALDLRDHEQTDVAVIADDTDIMCLLVHHSMNTSSSHELVSVGMVNQKQGSERKCYRINDVVKASDDVTNDFLLFAHSFTGTDTTSAVFNLGKTQILKKLKESEELRAIAKTFYKTLATEEEIGNAGIRVFELLYSKSGDSLKVIRHKKYDEMVASSRKTIDPSILPPSPRAAYFHGLRVYHQIQVWLTLSDGDLQPIRWGWELKKGVLTPIKTDLGAAPDSLLNIIRCGCKGQCLARCSCKKNGLKCSGACKECRGISCKNSDLEDIDEESLFSV